MKALLIKLRDYIEIEEAFQGMCGSITEMRVDDVITHEEYSKLKDYFSNNRKGKRYINNPPFWWKPKNKMPRLRWLNQQIKTLK